jgi:hypothetical protein
MLEGVKALLAERSSSITANLSGGGGIVETNACRVAILDDDVC